MKKELQKRANVIQGLQEIHVYRGAGFSLTVYDAVDVQNRAFLLVGIKALSK